MEIICSGEKTLAPLSTYKPSISTSQTTKQRVAPYCDTRTTSPTWICGLSANFSSAILTPPPCALHGRLRLPNDNRISSRHTSSPEPHKRDARIPPPYEGKFIRKIELAKGLPHYETLEKHAQECLYNHTGCGLPAIIAIADMDKIIAMTDEQFLEEVKAFLAKHH